MLKALKNKVLTYLTRSLLRTVVLEDFFVLSNGKIYFKSDISKVQHNNLIGEAKMIKDFELWKYMNQVVLRQANERMFNKSQCWEDMYMGKAFLYVMDIQNKIIDTLKSTEFKTEDNKIVKYIEKDL